MTKNNSIKTAYLLMKTISTVETVEESTKLVVQEPLNETTVPEKFHGEVLSWKHHANVTDNTRKKILDAFSGGDFTHFPLETSHNEMDADVVDHLVKHGYEIKDYKAGLATKKTTVGNPEKGIPYQEKYVDEKIGSALKKTGASNDIINAFSNDPARSSSTKSKDDLHVVISTSPLAIAGMSTGTRWSSCMNMHDGVNRSFLEEDSKRGTHIAYLVKGNDHTAFKYGEPSAPIARIALKPFHAHLDGEDETIFRPETRVYGDPSSTFASAVHQWATEKYPARHDVSYEKDPYVYNDTAEYYRKISKKDVEESINNGHSIVPHIGEGLDLSAINHGINVIQNKAKEIENNPELDPNNIKLAKNIGYFNDIGNLNPSHVSKLVRIAKPLKDNILIDLISSRHGDKLSKSAIDELYSDRVSDIPRKVLMSPKISDDLLDKLDASKYQYVSKSRIKPNHIDKIINSLNDKFPSTALQNVMDRGPALDHVMNLMNKDHIDALVNTSLDHNRDITPYVIHNKHFTEDHHNTLVRNYAVKNKDYTLEFIGKNSKFASMKDVDNGSYSIASLMKNKNTTDETKHDIARKIVSTFKDDPDATYFAGDAKMKLGISATNLPEDIVKHFTPDDYSSLAKKKIFLSFDSPKHSSNYLDALYDNAKELDKDITENKLKSEDKHKELIDRVRTYAIQMENHVYDHVEDPEDRFFLKNEDEHENIENRVSLGMTKNKNNYGSIDSFENYDPTHPETIEREKSIFNSAGARPSNIINEVRNNIHKLKRNGRLPQIDDEF